MRGTKKHIDKLFRDGLKSLSLFVSNKDMEAIDEKVTGFRDNENQVPDTESDPNLFSAFELPVDESDWLRTREKLDAGKAAMGQGNFMAEGFRDFELEVTENDWHQTYDKLRDARRRRRTYWWLSTGLLVLGLGSFLLSQIIFKRDNTIAINTANTNTQNTFIKPETQEAIKENSEIPDLQGNSGKGLSPELPKTMRSGNSPSEMNNSSKSRPNNSTENSGKKTPIEKVKPFEKSQYNKFNSEAGGEQLNDVSINGTTDIFKDKISDLLEDKVSKINEGTKDIVKNDQENQSEDKKTVEIPVIDTPKTDDNIPAKPKKVTANSFYVGIVNNLSVTHRQLDKSNNAFYNTIRNNAEKPMMQYAFGIEAGVLMKKMQFSIGAQVTSQAWVSNYNYTYRVHDSLPLKDPQGNIIGFFLVRGRDTSINESKIVRIQKFQMPFEFTRSFEINDKLAFTGTLGGLIGINTKTTGERMLNPVNNQLYHYDRLKQNERTMSFAPSAGFGMQYRINKSFVFQSAITGNYSLTSRFVSSFPAKDFPYSAGISVKMLYLINK